MIKENTVRQHLEELFEINLNGTWEQYMSSYGEIVQEVDAMSTKEVQSLRQSIMKKINTL